MPWIKFLKNNGFDVFAIVPSGAWNKHIEASGAKLVKWELSRSGRNPIQEIGSILGLARILRQIKPDIVHNFHTKPNIYAPIASKLAGIRLTVSTVTGLGYTFVERPGFASKLTQRINMGLYSISNRIANEITFQNPDDMALLRTRNALPRKKGQMIAGGSGIDVTEYHPNMRDSAASLKLRQCLGIPEGAYVAMFVGRLQLDKGLLEFVEAARSIRQKRKDIFFVMVGAPDPGNKRSINDSILNKWKSQGDVIFTGRREDVPNLMAMADTITAPTFYREGLPRTLLEAAATGLPLIGTDMPGVREAIKDGSNGILIPIQDSNALADSIEELADDPVKSRRYGAVSLKRAKEEFDHKLVIGKYITMYNTLWSKT